MSQEPPPDGPWRERGSLPPWDQEEADIFIGQYVLVGVTHLESDGKTVTDQVQYHGRIVSADRLKGFEIACEGKWAGRTMVLPPMTQVFQPANPGIYNLRSTGEAVENPDLIATWNAIAPTKS